MHACRSSRIARISGGLSRLTRDLLIHIFLTLEASTKGFLVQFADGEPPKRLFVHLWAIVGDEEALNSMCWTKGASGIMPCGVLCSVTNKPHACDRDRGIRSISDRDAMIPDISCPDLSKCGVRTDATVWKFCDDLEQSRKGELKDLENHTGIKLHLDTLLFCKELRPFLKPTQVLVFDPMHILFAGGIVGSEIMLCLGKVTDHVGAGFADARRFFEEKKFLPQTQAFSVSREKSSQATLKCGSSELLHGYLLFRVWLVQIYGPKAAEPWIVSIMLLFAICDEIRACLKHPSKAEVRARAVKLRELVPRYLRAFLSCYGIDAVKYKHHMLLHLPEQLWRNELLLSCWTMERKHIGAKSAMANQRCPNAVESTGLSRMLNQQLRMLEQPGWASVLGSPSSEFPELASLLAAARVRIASHMRFNGTKLASKDLVFLDLGQTYLALVVGCLMIDDSFGLIVRCCTRLTNGDLSSAWEVSPEPSLYRLTNERLFKAAAWRYVAPCKVEVIY